MKKLIKRKAMKNARLFKRIIELCDRVRPGDLFYWKRQGLVFKFCGFQEDSNQGFIIDGHIEVSGRMKVKILADSSAGEPGGSHKSYSLVHCLEWSPITVKDLPLHINAPIKYPEFDRMLKGR